MSDFLVRRKFIFDYLQLRLYNIYMSLATTKRVKNLLPNNRYVQLLKVNLCKTIQISGML